jgi:DNA-binding transcriptional ArsR family regulator
MEKNDWLLADARLYLRAIAASTVRPIAARVIDSYEKAQLYEKLDGHTAQLRLSEMTNIPQPTISVWLSKFTEALLVAPPDESHKGYRALYTLPELAINLSALSKKRVSPEPQVEPVPTEA